MTPRQARVALGGFFLLTIGVTSNALYLQGAVSGTAEKTAAAAIRPEPRRPDAPKSAKTAKTPVKTATAEAPQSLPPGPPQGASKGASKSPPSVKVRTVRVAAVGETRPEEADTDTLRAVQEELNRQGFGPIVADGVMRQPTRAAIMAFEHDHRLGLTGEASQDLLKKLVFGTPEDAAGDVEVRSPHAEAIVKQVQQSLIARGYRAGAVDGQVGAEIVAAIRTFETDQGLVPKGRISADVLERLQTGISAGGKHPVEGQ